MSHDLYVRSIDRRWRKMLRETHSRILVFSPYLTSPTADSVLTLVQPSQCEVHTVASIDNFVSGASSVRTVRRLLTLGFKLFHIENLHAKLVIVSGSCATVGSQNITAAGTRNLEASVAFSSTEDVLELERAVQRWLMSRRPIDLDELAEIERQVTPLKRKYRCLQNEMKIAEQSVTTAREDRIRREDHRQRVIQKALDQIDALGTISLPTARYFIARSVWWLTSKHGPVRAPRHERRIEGPEDDWRIRFGGNQFLVARALKRCLSQARDFMGSLKAGAAVSKSDLISLLWTAISGAVAKSDGEEYSGPYPVHGTEMHFGAQAIDVADFVGAFMEWTTLGRTLSEIGVV